MAIVATTAGRCVSLLNGGDGSSKQHGGAGLRSSIRQSSSSVSHRHRTWSATSSKMRIASVAAPTAPTRLVTEWRGSVVISAPRRIHPRGHHTEQEAGTRAGAAGLCPSLVCRRPYHSHARCHPHDRPASHHPAENLSRSGPSPSALRCALARQRGPLGCRTLALRESATGPLASLLCLAAASTVTAIGGAFVWPLIGAALAEWFVRLMS